MTSGGDWIEQARRLVDSLRAAAPATPATAPDPGAAPAGGPNGGPAGGAAGDDCRWCPLCQAAAVVRGERPEVTAALADILAATATALRQFAGEPTARAGSAPEDTAPERAGGTPRPVQQIVVS